MKRPILGYGNPMLRQRCKEINENFPNVQQLINDMWDTMQQAGGCGLAAPQIGCPIRLFIVDSKTSFERFDKEEQTAYFEKEDTGILETFINAKIVHRSNEFWEDEEGCLSIPNLFQKVKRPWTITIEYLNKNFEQQTRTFSGMTARMIQHEYDHTEGILYLDYLQPIKRKLMESKLRKIMKGQVQTKYPMKFL